MVVAHFVDRHDGGGFRHTVPLQDVDAEPQERTAHFRVERGAARNEDTGASAEDAADAGSHFLVEKPGNERIKKRKEPALNRKTVFAAETTVPDVDRRVKELLHEGRFLDEGVLNFVVDLFIDARYAHQDCRPDDFKVVGEKSDVAVKGHTVAEPHGGVVRRRAFKGMRERQKGEPHVFGFWADVLQDARDVGKNRTVGEHDALGFSGGAGGVDECRQILRLGPRGEFRAVALRQPLIKSNDPHVAVLMLLNGFARDDDGFQGGMVFRVANRFPTVQAPRDEQLCAAVVDDVT